MEIKENECMGKVATARRDGTTERVNAIVNGLLLSKKYGLEFEFSWINLEGNEFHCMTYDVPEFFAHDFITKHYREMSHFKKYKIEGFGCTYPSEYVSGFYMRGSDSNRKSLLDKAKRKEINIVPATYQYGGRYSSTIDDVFSQEYLPLKKRNI
ncbi:MAG: hypothetical protein V5789_11040 [Colwellia sp.]